MKSLTKPAKTGLLTVGALACIVFFVATPTTNKIENPQPVDFEAKFKTLEEKIKQQPKYKQFVCNYTTAWIIQHPNTEISFEGRVSTIQTVVNKINTAKAKEAKDVENAINKIIELAKLEQNEIVANEVKRALLRVPSLSASELDFYKNVDMQNPEYYHTGELIKQALLGSQDN